MLCPLCYKMHNHGVTFFTLNEASSKVIEDLFGRFKYNGQTIKVRVSKRLIQVRCLRQSQVVFEMDDEVESLKSTDS
jgi:hypothetical protein